MKLYYYLFILSIAVNALGMNISEDADLVSSSSESDSSDSDSDDESVLVSLTLTDQASLVVARQAIAQYDHRGYVAFEDYLAPLPEEVKHKIYSLIIQQFPSLSIFVDELILTCKQSLEDSTEYLASFNTEDQVKIIKQLYRKCKDQTDLTHILLELVQVIEDTEVLAGLHNYIDDYSPEHERADFENTLLKETKKKLDAVVLQFGQDILSFSEQSKKFGQLILLTQDKEQKDFFSTLDAKDQQEVIQYLLCGYALESTRRIDASIQLNLKLLQPTGIHEQNYDLLYTFANAIKLYELFMSSHKSLVDLCKKFEVEESSEFYDYVRKYDKRMRVYTALRLQVMQAGALCIKQTILTGNYNCLSELKKVLLAVPVNNLTGIYELLFVSTEKEAYYFLTEVLKLFIPILLDKITDLDELVGVLYDGVSKFYKQSNIQEPLVTIFEKQLAQSSHEKVDDILQKIRELFLADQVAKSV